MQVVHFVCMQCMLCVQTECCLYALHVSESAKDLLGLPVLTAFWAYPAIRCKLDNHSAISRHYLKKFLDNALFCLHVYFSFLMNFKQFLFYQKIKHLLLPICTCCSADAYITSELFFFGFSELQHLIQLMLPILRRFAAMFGQAADAIVKYRDEIR